MNTSVTVTVAGAGFGPSSTITIEFDGTPVATSPSTVTSTTAGFFTATFNVPPSSNEILLLKLIKDLNRLQQHLK